MQASGEEDLVETYGQLMERLKSLSSVTDDMALSCREHLQRLSVSLRRQGNPEYAALAGLGLARCEQALSDVMGEAAMFVSSGRLLWQKERDEAWFGQCTFADGSTQATQSFSLAIQLYLSNEKHAMAAALYVEMGRALVALDRPHKAIQCFHHASNLLRKTTGEGGPPSLASLHVSRMAVPQLTADAEYEMALRALSVIERETTFPAGRAQATPDPALAGHRGTRTTSVTPSYDLDAYTSALVDAHIMQTLLLLKLGDYEHALQAVEALVIISDSTALDPVLPDLLESLAHALERGPPDACLVLIDEIAQWVASDHLALLSTLVPPPSSSSSSPSPPLRSASALPLPP